MSDTPQKTPPARRAGPVFLERATYRQRRLIDAARLMPVLGAFLWIIPLLWARGVTLSSAALLYIFGVWFILVVGAALLSRGIRGVDWTGDGKGETGEGR